VPTDPAAQPWTLRSSLIAVSDLERSVGFYRQLGPFEIIAEGDGVAVLGGVTPTSPVLLLRETRSLHQMRHGQQSLGLRSITFNVGALAELDRIEATLRRGDHFTERRRIDDDASELIRGRDPDNLPLVFVSYATDTVGPEYYKTIINLIYSMDA
jgi:hypothetical protein